MGEKHKPTLDEVRVLKRSELESSRAARSRVRNRKTGRRSHRNDGGPDREDPRLASWC
jgi:hypothetical protein